MLVIDQSNKTIKTININMILKRKQTPFFLIDFQRKMQTSIYLVIHFSFNQEINIEDTNDNFYFLNKIFEQNRIIFTK